MGFIGTLIDVVVDIVVDIVEAVVQIVEMVVQVIMVLLGFDGGTTQIVEYYEVRNYPLFEDVDKQNPLLQSILQSILANKDISSNLIYHLVYRSLKGDIQGFMNYIEQGNYFEGFPAIESYILIIDYDELTAALQTLTGVACTPEFSALKALSKSDWVKYWLQENKEYDVGANLLGIEYREVTTGPYTPASDTVNVTPSLNHFQIDITRAIAPSDDVLTDMRWHINLNTISYNSVPDTYTIQAYNAAGITITLPYTAPSRPTQLHYVSEYYRNVDPNRTYLFVYKVGEGTYTDLDTVEEPINIDNTTLQALPAVPLRISNANYTTFAAAKKNSIEELLMTIHLDAEDILNTIMADSGLAAGDLDNIYINFGVRMWDTSQAGMGYLFKMFENLYPSQAVTQGIYNNSPAGDDKPANNIHTTTDDNTAAFQFNYITYTFTSLATINANSGSPENGIYYSDMSKFNDNNILVYPYYSSSGKGTYNVGYKADDLDEVQDFLDGNGVTNPGTTTSEATNWLQVTERLVYNNTTPVLLDPDGTTSNITYLTPDRVYENNGSGVLRAVQQASAETTAGQSITYYCIKPNGLEAYTVVGPIGAMRVVDGDTSKFKVVKFNLGDKGDLMVPFIHTFVKDLSNTEVSKLFLAGAHASLYVAHYEVIHHAGMDLLTAIVMIIIIIVIIYYIYTTGDKEGGMTLFESIVAAAAAGGWTAVATVLFKYIATLAFKFVVQMIIQEIIVAVLGDTELAQMLSLLVGLAIASWDIQVGYTGPNTAPVGSYGHTGGATIGSGGGSLTTMPGSSHIYVGNVYIQGKLPSFDSLTSLSNKSPWELLNMGEKALNTIGKLFDIRLQSMTEELEEDLEQYAKLQKERRAELKAIDDFIDTHAGLKSNDLLYTQKKMYQTSYLNADSYYMLWNNKAQTMIDRTYAFDFHNNIESANQFG